MSKAKPFWVFHLWCLGAGDDICARDAGLPISRMKRLFWRVRGFVLMSLFGWFWWETERHNA